VSGVGDRSNIPDPDPVVDPGIKPNTTTNETTTAVNEKKGSSNLALIIGIVIGAIGFVAIGGFLVYYIMKKKSLQSQSD